MFYPDLTGTWCAGKSGVSFQLLVMVYRFCRGQPAPEWLDQVVSDGQDFEEIGCAGKLSRLKGPSLINFTESNSI